MASNVLNFHEKLSALKADKFAELDKVNTFFLEYQDEKVQLLSDTELEFRRLYDSIGNSSNIERRLEFEQALHNKVAEQISYLSDFQAMAMKVLKQQGNLIKQIRGM